ncbi:hypothetical protein HY373_01160 [Candidatus Berkelbacteria bacterium]|nr:hypothetical protein [Candidatus Berkelbacteria bacterium]
MQMQELALILTGAAFWARQAWQEGSLVTVQNLETRSTETMDWRNLLDEEIDSHLMERIKERLGVERFLTEEGAKIPERNQVGGKRAVLDSLDGSSNLATYRPDFGISAAIEEGGRPVLGGIVTPIRGELLVAAPSEGVHFFSCYGRALEEVLWMIKDGKTDKVTTQSFAIPQKKEMDSPLKTARIYVHTGKRRNFELLPTDPWNTLYAKLANPGCSFSCTVALVEVALGKLDAAAVAYQNYWDFAAGRLLVQEAGGTFEAWDRCFKGQLTDSDMALANAAKTPKGDEWLCHILAGGTPEIVIALREHFLSV